MTDSELFALDKSGLVPSAYETEKEFLQRVEETKKGMEGEKIPESHWDWTRTFLLDLFDVKPLYIWAFYENRGLSPWEGAACFTKGRRLEKIHLRKALRRGNYLGLYNREEILAHEAVHAARSGFEESRFEEFFAFWTSERAYRRILGPIVRRPWEVWPLLILFFAGIFSPFFHILASALIVFAFLRLIRGHWILKKAFRHLLPFVKGEREARAVLFRLMDCEIIALAKGKLALKGEENSLRRRALKRYWKEVV